MTRQEFLEELRASLTNEVTAEVIMDAYQYYSSYIDDGVRSGKSEEEVIEELGKPFLIARSIIAAHVGERDADLEYTEDGKTKKIHHSTREKENKTQKEKKVKTEKKEFYFDINAWYMKLLGILIFVILVLVVFFILKIGFFFLITFGIPILIILGIIYLILYFIK